MQPGLPRALPMGIVGFLIGAALVYILRGLQSMDPVWDPQLGLVLGGFMGAGFFVWGIGAFNPKLSEHHIHAPEEFELVPAAHHDDHHEEEHGPFALLSQQMWQVAFWTIVLVVVLFGFATISGGFFVRTTNDALGSTADVGYTTLRPLGHQFTLFGQEIVFSELSVFILLAVFTFASLGAVGGGIAWIMTRLSQNVAEAKATPAGEAVALPAGTVVTPRRKVDLGVWRVLAAIVVFVVLYFLFSTVLIPPLLNGVSNAVFGTDAPVGISMAVVAVPVSAVLALLGTQLLLWREFFIGNPGKYLTAAAVTIVLYLLFYYALIGMVVGGESPALVPLSLVNTLLVVFILFWSGVFVLLVGMGARLLLRVLRGVPAFLGQK